MDQRDLHAKGLYKNQKSTKILYKSVFYTLLLTGCCWWGCGGGCLRAPGGRSSKYGSLSRRRCSSGGGGISSSCQTSRESQRRLSVIRHSQEKEFGAAMWGCQQRSDIPSRASPSKKASTSKEHIVGRTTWDVEKRKRATSKSQACEIAW